MLYKPASIYYILLFTLHLLACSTNAIAKNQELNNSRLEVGRPQSNNQFIHDQHAHGNGITSPRLTALAQPYRDEAILPFSTEIRQPLVDKLKLVATPGEYESGSLLLQSGKSPLTKLQVTITDLTTTDQKHVIPTNTLDVRLVKAWFQSAKVMRRSQQQAKTLVPELLLHDNKLVTVDYASQTNNIRLNPGISDAESLQPFSLPAHTNQQLWVTINIPEDAAPGTYRGTLTVQSDTSSQPTFDKNIKIELTVLPFRLAETKLLMGQFYLAWLTNTKRTYYNARGKNMQQMLAELSDMKQHGVNFIAVDHNYQQDRQAINLRKQLSLVKQAGLDSNPVVYVDWRVTEHDDPVRYREKLQIIQQAFKDEDIDTFWVYNKDEKKLRELTSSLHTFTSTHKLGAKNIVAVTRPSIALKLGDYLDYVLIQHKTPKPVIQSLKKAGITPLAYGLPHAGEEKPASTRYTYGFGLVEKGFAGTLSYAYQSGEAWDDWMNWEKSNYRPNVMAYPTDSTPIPTLQWEAWREAVDDLKYLETSARQSSKSLQAMLNEAVSHVGKHPQKIREYLTAWILNNKQ